MSSRQLGHRARALALPVTTTVARVAVATPAAQQT
jgi:hypothetical protein